MNFLDQYRFQVDARRRAGRGTLRDLIFTRIRNAWINWRRRRLTS